MEMQKLRTAKIFVARLINQIKQALVEADSHVVIMSIEHHNVDNMSVKTIMSYIREKRLRSERERG